MLIDSHCHILSSEYEKPEDVIEDSKTSGVDKMIINGYDLESSAEAVLLSNEYNYVYASIGIGPENIDDVSDKDFIKLEELINKGKVVAIGEIGLDYYWTKDNKEKQIYVFENMLALAKKYNLPVIVHCRQAIKDTYELLKKYKINGILHCFSGSAESAKEFIKLGFLIGIGGVVTFKNAKEIKEIVKEIDLSNISLETDSPYLSPEPLRGKVNVPKNVIYVARKIAELKNVSLEEVLEVTSSNVTNKFDLYVYL